MNSNALDNQNKGQGTTKRSLTTFAAYLQSKPRFFSDRVLRSHLCVLLFLRVLVITAVVGSNLWLAIEGTSDVTSFSTWFTLSLYSLTFLNLYAVLKLRFPLRIAFFQLFTDIALCTFANYYTGSPVTAVVYLMSIVGSALIFSGHGALITAALSALSYAILRAGLLPGEYNLQALSISELILVYLSFVMIGLVSGYLAHKLELAKNEVDSAIEHVHSLEKQHNTLINDLSEGIITLDSSMSICSINEAAQAIFGLNVMETDSLRGKDLLHFLRSQSRSTGNPSQEEPPLALQADGEIVLAGQNPSLNRTLTYRLRPLLGNAGQAEGQLFLFNDLTKVRQIENRLGLHEKLIRLLALDTSFQFAPQTQGSSINMVGQSTVMKKIFSLVSKLANSSASVLIWGESGTGKELIARAIHGQGDRALKPYIAVNCGAIPESLMESELFGHKKGSFTGAIADNPGLFRRAHGGTIFLDEIGELPLSLQTKLLRVLQEKTVRAIGDSKDVDVDVRVIAATNRDLRREIEKGNFREDLYYRINVVNLFVPPLRERKEDLELLIGHFIQRYAKDPDNIPQISPKALEIILSYPFPGNIRELENVIERALVLGGPAILPEHLPEDLHRHSEILRGLPIGTTTPTVLSELSLGSNDTPHTNVLIVPIDLEAELARIEQQYLVQALQASKGIKKNAAQLLGLNFRSFRYRLKKYGMASGSGDEADSTSDL